jgi:hypothetical protein
MMLLMQLNYYLLASEKFTMLGMLPTRKVLVNLQQLKVFPSLFPLRLICEATAEEDDLEVQERAWLHLAIDVVDERRNRLAGLLWSRLLVRKQLLCLVQWYLKCPIPLRQWFCVGLNGLAEVH